MKGTGSKGSRKNVIQAPRESDKRESDKLFRGNGKNVGRHTKLESVSQSSQVCTYFSTSPVFCCHNIFGHNSGSKKSKTSDADTTLIGVFEALTPSAICVGARLLPSRDEVGCQPEKASLDWSLFFYG